MNKTQLRKSGIARLQQMQPAAKKQKEQTILALLFASEQWRNARSVGVIRSLPYELDTTPILTRGLAEGKIMTVPMTEAQGLVFFQVLEDTEYRKSAFGVEEPISNQRLSKQDIELILVPGLVFSKTGYRIGFGGGYYDRYLADYSGNTISLVFSEQFRESWQPESFDIPIQKIITDTYPKGETT